MKLLQIRTYRHSQYTDLKLDDDTYAKYKTARIRHMISGDSGNSYVNIFDETKNKWVSFSRLILNIDDRKKYVVYIDDDETNLCRENLRLVSRGDINRKRPPIFYGRMFKGTSYLDGSWYSIVYLPQGQKFVRKCASEADAAIIYDSTLNYLGLPGYRNFADIGTKHLSPEDILLLDGKTKKRVNNAKSNYTNRKEA